MGYVVCGGCAAPIPPQHWNAGAAIPCPACSREVEVMLFAAATHPPRAATVEKIVGGEEASCYNHPMNRAASACDACGRFLCSLCDLPVNASHVCPACLTAGTADFLQGATVTQRVNYDTLALALVTFPMLFCWLPVITTPIAVYIALRHWNQPSPVTPRAHWRGYLTIFIAIVQVVTVITLIVLLATKGGAS